jgi:hypothetical protein
MHQQRTLPAKTCRATAAAYQMPQANSGYVKIRITHLAYSERQSKGSKDAGVRRSSTPATRTRYLCLYRIIYTRKE